VATPVSTTAGIPYSRATTAQWLGMPSVSVTTADAVRNKGVQGSEVVRDTRISPGGWPPEFGEVFDDPDNPFYNTRRHRDAVDPRGVITLCDLCVV